MKRKRFLLGSLGFLGLVVLVGVVAALAVWGPSPALAEVILPSCGNEIVEKGSGVF